MPPDETASGVPSVSELMVALERVAREANRFVDDAVAAKRLVVVACPAVSKDEYRFVEVALVVVALSAVKFWSVVEPSAANAPREKIPPAPTSRPPPAKIFCPTVSESAILATLLAREPMLAAGVVMPLMSIVCMPPLSADT